MAVQKTPKTALNDIIAAISGFSRGDFNVKIEATDDPEFNSIINALNNASRALSSQVQLASEKLKAQLEVEKQFAINALGLGIWTLDPKSKALHWDSGMYRLYDVDPENFSGAFDAWENSLTPEALARAVNDLQLALSGEKQFDTTFQIKLRNGGIRHLAVRAVVLRNESGEPTQMYGVNWDVTEQSRITELLLSEQTKTLSAAERFVALFESSPNPILVFTENGITDCNRAAIEILRCPTKELLIAQHPARFSPEFQSDGRSSAEKSVEMDGLARQKKLHRFDWDHQTFDGRVFPVEVTMAPIVWSENDALLVLWTDLTERRRCEVQFSQIAKMASLGEMSAGIAHEINNPLAIISGTMRLLTKCLDDPEKLAHKIETIQKATGRISKIVMGLKKFSRSADKSAILRHSLADIAEEALTLTSSKAAGQNTSVTLDCQVTGLIDCDEVGIEQVLINLINNAVDAVQANLEKWVKVSVLEENSSVVIRVMDSGAGIPEPIRSKLFQPFFTTKPTGEGTGLGLSITKGILDEHQATIIVVAECPNTCFEIRFPKAKVNQSVA